MLISPVARPMAASDDYDTWEQAVSAEDLRGLDDSSKLTTVICDVTYLFLLAIRASDS